MNHTHRRGLGKILLVISFLILVWANLHGPLSSPNISREKLFYNAIVLALLGIGAQLASRSPQETK